MSVARTNDQLVFKLQDRWMYIIQALPGYVAELEYWT